MRALSSQQEFRLTILHIRISGGSSSLMRATKSGTPGLSLMSFMETTFPAAWTPASVLAARPRLTWRGYVHISVGNEQPHTDLGGVVCIVLRHTANLDQRVEQGAFNGAYFLVGWLTLGKTETRDEQPVTRTLKGNGDVLLHSAISSTTETY